MTTRPRTRRPAARPAPPETAGTPSGETLPPAADAAGNGGTEEPEGAEEADGGEGEAPLDAGARFRPLVPLRDTVVFPYMVVPLFIGRKRSLRAIERAVKGDRKLVLLTQAESTVEQPKLSDLHRAGCLAEILQMLKLPDGTYKILVEGKSRVRVERMRLHGGMFEAACVEIVERVEPSLELSALRRRVTDQFEQFIKLNRKIPIEIMMVIMNTEDPGRLADIVVAHLQLSIAEKQRLLEAADVRERLEAITVILDKEIEILGIERKIKNRVKEQLEGMQKEYYLREQIKAIQKELGHEDDLAEEIREYRARLDAIASLTEEARKQIGKEIGKLEKTHAGSPEAAVLRTWIDWTLDLPWDKVSEDRLDLAEAARVLDEDHYDLVKVKERILEFLAVRSRVPKLKGPILCLVGPPGVGKTSLGRSVARALGREFARISLGGVKDEAEIRGHRRTYVGAMAGRILQALHRAKSANPVCVLDEIDKLASDFRGDPTSALLEVLDPEQNNAFVDHYLNLPFDLSRVLFITTANLVQPIPPALRDRMETIRIPGYTEGEKAAIAARHLIPKQLSENGLEPRHLAFTHEAVIEIIRRYTREAGVRSLEREIGAVCRKRVKELVATGDERRVEVTPEAVANHLGAPRFTHGLAERRDLVGRVNGLAWTEVGGVLLDVEAALTKGRGQVLVTGQVGDVMRESARAAHTWIRSHAAEFGIDPKTLDRSDLHVHCPEGATPKDGPSAGIAILAAMLSAATGRKVACDVAVTGEITLRGRVLPVGGIKEKALAALAEGVPEVILPADNRKDVEEIPAELRDRLAFLYVETVDAALARLLR